MNDTAKKKHSSQPVNYLHVVLIVLLVCIYFLAGFLILKLVSVQNNSKLTSAQNVVNTNDLCDQRSLVLNDPFALAYSLPASFTTLSETPHDLEAMFVQPIEEISDMYALYCNDTTSYVLIYGFEDIAPEKGVFEHITSQNIRTNTNDLVTIYAQTWKDSHDTISQFTHYTADIRSEGSYHLRLKLITMSHDVEYFQDLFKDIITSTTSNSEPISKKKQTYTHTLGYAFTFTNDNALYEQNTVVCSNGFCLGGDSTTTIHSLLITGYASNEIHNLDYDQGYDVSSYKKPEKIIIDGVDFYIIQTKDGFLQEIVPAYKIAGDVLWVKKYHRVTTPTNSYYISFDASVFPETIGTETIKELKTILKTFTF